jgi:hypothetical protein
MSEISCENVPTICLPRGKYVRYVIGKRKICLLCDWQEENMFAM